MDKPNQQIGNLVAEIRKDRQLTQAQLATAIGTSQAAINRIERGKQNLSIETLGRISSALRKQIFTIAEPGVNLRVEGGHKLRGSISVNSSKNATVAILCASLLNRGTTKLKHVPKIEEVKRILEVLQSIGVSVRWDGNDLEVKPPAKLNLGNINKAASVKTRSVIMLAGPLIHEFSSFTIPHAGGCKLGKRTILPHIYALEAFGAQVQTKADKYIFSVKPAAPKNSLVLYEAGDTVTENAIMAAARFEGETTIKLASANYMVQDLCFYLRKLGVKIEGIGTSTLKIKGIRQIKKNVTYWPSEDPVEAMTFISAAIACDSTITVRRSPIDFLELELLKLSKMGLRIERGLGYKSKNGQTNLADITIHAHGGKLSAPEEKIHPLPSAGINIDNLPYFIPAVAVARGRTLIHDWVYEDRALMYTEMKKVGVDIELADPHRVFINGPTRWAPAEIIAPNGIRPAVILLIGMMAAPGVSILRNIYTINRGYEDLAARLNSLGARITVI